MCVGVAGNIDFGATSVYPTAEEWQSLLLSDIKLVPVALYAVAPVYHVNVLSFFLIEGLCSCGSTKQIMTFNIYGPVFVCGCVGDT